MQPSSPAVFSNHESPIIADQYTERNSQARVGAVFVAGLSPPAVEQDQESIGEETMLHAITNSSELGTPEHSHPTVTAMAYAVDHNDSEDAEEAIPVVKNSRLCISVVSNRWLKLLVILSLIAVVVSVTVSLFVKPGFSSKQDRNDPEDPQQNKNTRDNIFTSVAEELSREEVLADPNSAQSRALNWLIYYDTATIPFGDNDRAKQRYAATVLYFSTGGPTTWTQQNEFLHTGKHECDWYTIEPETGRKKGIECLHVFNTIITQVDLSKMNMTGTIPKEILQLQWLVTLDFSENKNMTGTIPQKLQELSRLEKIYLNDMDLSGSIPNDISTLEYLDDVRLYGNERLQQNFESLCINYSGCLIEVDCVDPTKKQCSCCTCFRHSEVL